MCLGHTENQYHPSLYDLSLHNVHISAFLFISQSSLVRDGTLDEQLAGHVEWFGLFELFNSSPWSEIALLWTARSVK